MGAASMDRGWVKVWRSLRGSALAKRGPAWELLMIHLIMDAEWAGDARGTLTVSVRDYARREGLDREMLRWMLDTMVEEGFIQISGNGSGRSATTTIRIMKYAEYQETDSTQSSTHLSTQSSTHLEDEKSDSYDNLSTHLSTQSSTHLAPISLTTTEEEFKKEHTQNARAHVREEPPPSGWLPSGAPPGLEAYPTRPEEVTAAAELLGFRMESSEGLQFLLFWQERDWTLSDGSKVRSWRTSLHRWLSHPRRDYLNGRHDGQSRENQRIWSEDRRKRVGGIGADYYSGSDVEWLRRQGLLPG